MLIFAIFAEGPVSCCNLSPRSHLSMTCAAVERSPEVAATPRTHSDEAMEGLKSSNLLVGFLDAEKKTETLDGKDFLTFEVVFFLWAEDKEVARYVSEY